MIFNGKEVDYVESYEGQKRYSSAGHPKQLWKCYGCHKYGSLALFYDGERCTCAICQSCVIQMLEGFKKESKAVMDENWNSNA